MHNLSVGLPYSKRFKPVTRMAYGGATAASCMANEWRPGTRDGAEPAGSTVPAAPRGCAVLWVVRCGSDAGRVDGLALALGPVERKEARQRHAQPAAASPAGSAEAMVAPPALPDSPTARYQRWPKEDVSEIHGSDRESPVDEMPLSPENCDDAADTHVTL